MSQSDPIEVSYIKPLSKSVTDLADKIEREIRTLRAVLGDEQAMINPDLVPVEQNDTVEFLRNRDLGSEEAMNVVLKAISEVRVLPDLASSDEPLLAWSTQVDYGVLTEKGHIYLYDHIMRSLAAGSASAAAEFENSYTDHTDTLGVIGKRTGFALVTTLVVALFEV